MRDKLCEEIEIGRIITGPMASERGDMFGAFWPICGLRIISSGIGNPNGSPEEQWEHVSVSLPERIPFWDEMCKVKEWFWRDDETVVQFHPPKEDHVNFHPHCLHLWKHVGTHYQLPPKSTIAPS